MELRTRHAHRDATRCCRWARALLLLCLVIAWSARPARAADIETEHLFGFTIGSDIGGKGEKEAESETEARLGKNGGSYAALSQQLEAKNTLTENFRIAASAVFAYHGISNVPDMDDRRQVAFEGFSFEAGYRFLDREHSPVGLTFFVEPHWNRVDDITGEPVVNYGGRLTLALDRELVARTLFAAVNVLYVPEVTHFAAADAWMRQATLGLSGAVAAQVREGIFVGAELRALRLYDSLAFGSLAGQALFVGPSVYARLSEHWWASFAWNAQIAGHAADRPGALDLLNFERHQFMARAGYQF